MPTDPDDVVAEIEKHTKNAHNRCWNAQYCLHNNPTLHDVAPCNWPLHESIDALRDLALRLAATLDNVNKQHAAAHSDLTDALQENERLKAGVAAHHRRIDAPEHCPCCAEVSRD